MKIRFVGLDVHAETIAVAVAESDGTVLSLGTIPNREEPVRKLIKKLGGAEQLRVCYEAGPVRRQKADLSLRRRKRKSAAAPFQDDTPLSLWDTPTRNCSDISSKP
jgi:hypothetical protein